MGGLICSGQDFCGHGEELKTEAPVTQAIQDYTRVLLVKTQLAGSSRPQASENQTVGSVCNFLLRSYFN
jgi:hypothetical protein